MPAPMRLIGPPKAGGLQNRLTARLRVVKSLAVQPANPVTPQSEASASRSGIGLCQWLMALTVSVRAYIKWLQLTNWQ